MIKFFRKVRQNMIKENKASKYLLYALGEIILVVIGILIALQINNWNQGLKDNKAEKIMISDLKRSLVSTEQQLQKITIAYHENLEAMNRIYEHLKNKRPYSDSLKTQFIEIESYVEPLFEIGVYEGFKNQGLLLINNDSLKTAIIQLYEAQLPQISEKLTGNIELIASSTLLPLNVQLFTYDGFDMIPNNYELLLSNQQYLNAISYMRSIKTYTMFSAERLQENITALINALTVYQNQL